MAVKANHDEFLAVNEGQVEDISFVSVNSEIRNNESDILSINVANSLGGNTVYEFNFNEIVNEVVSSMNNLANQAFKGSKFLEPREVEKIKASLVNYEARSQRISEIKAELEKFESSIQENYTQRINEYNQEKVQIKAQIEMFEKAKKQIVNQRASQMLWPFNAETKACDSKIAALKIKFERCAQKISAMTEMRPAASEKDILMFQIQLKDKFAA